MVTNPLLFDYNGLQVSDFAECLTVYFYFIVLFVSMLIRKAPVRWTCGRHDDGRDRNGGHRGG